jgi:DNA-binding Lrp family transcriptional regulator
MPAPITPAPPALRDTLDRELIALLQTNARESAANLARKLGTARTTVLARLSRLERVGVIAGYTVRLAQDVLNQGLQAFVGLTVSPKAGREVEARLARMFEVRQLCAVSGEFDYVLLLHAESAVRLNTLLDDIRNLEGVVKTTTSVALAWKIERT